MVQSYPELVRRALEIFRRGFKPFVECQMLDMYGSSWQPEARLDTQALLRIILDNWDSIFGEMLGPRGRGLVDRVRKARNKLAHEDTLNLTDVHHILEDIEDLLTRISAHQEVREIDQLRQEIEPEQTKLESQIQKGWATREWQQAQAIKEEQVRKVQQDSQLWVERAKRSLANKQYEDVVFALDRAIQLDPNNSDAYQSKAIMMKELGRLQEALEALSYAIRLRPNDSLLYSDRGYMLIKIGRYPAALDSSNSAIRFNPNNSHAFVNKGAALNSLELFQEALEALSHAIQLDPNHGTVHRNLGYTLLRLEKFQEALEALNRAIQFDPSDSPSLINKGDALNRLGRYQEALEAYKRAEKIDPSNTKARAEREDLERQLRKKSIR